MYLTVNANLKTPAESCKNIELFPSFQISPCCDHRAIGDQLTIVLKDPQEVMWYIKIITFQMTCLTFVFKTVIIYE